MKSVDAFIFSAVGIRNSDFGVFELMWKPLPTRNSSGTVADLPRVMVMVGGGANVTDGAFIPGEFCPGEFCPGNPVPRRPPQAPEPAPLS